MGQIAHPGRAAGRGGAALLLGLSLLGGTVLTGCGSSLAAATTTLAGVADAQVVHADGAVVAAVDGLRLHRGDVVRTGLAGRAELHTRGRVVYEGSDAAVQVLDGARSDLRHGAVVVDAQHGPALNLAVAGLHVTAPAGAAVRAERSVTVRIAALAGSVGVDSSTGRHLDVGALTQAVVGGDALPDSTAASPLRLTDDDGEAHAVPALVRDDVALNSLAAGIDSTGSSTVKAVTAAWRSGLETLPTGVARSEQVLPIVIAATARTDAPTRYRDAVALRQAGASWAVVAHRLNTTAAAVLAALDLFERGAATGQVGTVPAALAFLTGPGVPGNAAGSGGRGGPGGRSADGSSGGTSGGSTGGASSSGGSSGGQPGPAPSSSPGTVSGTIDRVLSLVPTPAPTPTSVLPAPVPLPSVSVPSLSVPSLPSAGQLTPAPAPALLTTH